MNYLLQVDTGLYALILLGLVLLTHHNRLLRGQIEYWLFAAMVKVNIVMLIFDALSWFVDGLPGKENYLIVVFCNFLNFLPQPLLSILWLIFVGHYVYGPGARLERVITWSLLGLSSYFIILAFNSSSGFLYFIDGANFYHRGPFFPYYLAFCMVPLVVALSIIQFNRNSLPKNVYLPFALFALPPIIGTIFQGMFFGANTLWASSALSLFILFIFVQHGNMSADYLTGLHNRRHLDKFLDNICRRGRTFGVIFLDVDCFKAINDNYGHLVGDDVLREVALILKQSAGRRAFIARYGGDEFVIVLWKMVPGDMDKVVKEIQQRTRALPWKMLKGKAPGLSMGRATFYGGIEDSRDVVLRKVDQLMYEQKLKRKAMGE